MSRNLALEKVGRARVAYRLQQKGWLVGEAFDDGYDLLAVHPVTKDTCKIELKTMDIDNRATGVNLTAPVSTKEQETCTHIIIYLEPVGEYFIAKKEKVLTSKGNIFAALNADGELRSPKTGSYSFANFKDSWQELFADEQWYNFECCHKEVASGVSFKEALNKYNLDPYLFFQLQNSLPKEKHIQEDKTTPFILESYSDDALSTLLKTIKYQNEEGVTKELGEKIENEIGRRRKAL